MMIADHSKAEQMLQRAAKTAGLAVSMTLDATHQTMLDALQGTPGAAFDTAYVADQVKAHRETAEMAAAAHTMAGDEIIKNSLANFAFENFEIATYKSLITLAEATGHSQSVALLQASLLEEQSMADWLDSNLKAVTLKFLSLEEAGQSGKV